ncbi:MAG: flagellar motor switch protein FliG [Verrucomicrobiae bacterium]
MTATEYGSMSKVQKVAAFLITLGEEQAGQLLEQFNDDEIEGVVREMAAMEVVGFDLQERVVEDLCILLGTGLNSTLGGVPFAQKALIKAKGSHVASNILLKALPAAESIDAVRELDNMDTRQIYSLIKEEQPQTISFLFSYLEPKKIAAILPFFPPAHREEIVERLGSMEPISSELIRKVLLSLSKRIASGPQKHTIHRRGGVNTVAQLLNALDREASKTLLARIEERNAPLAAAIRKKLFSMEDIARMTPGDIQKVLRSIESADICMVLKTASEKVRKALFGGLSKRAAESLKEELENLGPVRIHDIEEAQDRIIATISGLAEAGEVVLNFDSDDIVA